MRFMNVLQPLFRDTLQPVPPKPPHRERHNAARRRPTLSVRVDADVYQTLVSRPNWTAEVRDLLTRKAKGPWWRRALESVFAK